MLIMRSFIFSFCEDLLMRVVALRIEGSSMVPRAERVKAEKLYKD